MKRPLKIALISLGVVALLGALAFVLSEKPRQADTFNVKYRGRLYALPKVNPGYNDAQAREIAAVIEQENPPATFATYAAMMAYHNDLEPRGCQSSTGGFGDPTPLGKMTFISVQLPNQPRYRVMTYHLAHDGEPYRFLESFYDEGLYPPVYLISCDAGQLVYRDEKTGRVIRRASLPSFLTAPPS